MSDLRLALLVIGGLILVAIYLYGQWEARRKESRNPERRDKQRPAVSVGREKLELSAGLTESGQGGKDLPLEPEFRPPFQAVAEAPGRKDREEELLEDLDDMADLVEEAKDHHPHKIPEQAEIMTSKKVKKSRFTFPTRWMRKKRDPALTSEAAPSPTASPPPKESRRPELVIVLTVVAAERNGFRGRDIVQVLEERNLQYGEMDIYHAYSPGGRPIFSVANMVEPGTFDLATIDNFITPGLALFLRLPGPAGGFAAFDAMLDTARLLAERLHGEICDERRNVLTAQALAQTRERILAFNRTRRSLGV